jgi:transposase
MVSIRDLVRVKSRKNLQRPYALNSVAAVAPEWLQAWVPNGWFDRYGTRVDNYRLPKSDKEREALAALIGTDGVALLQRIEATTDLPWLGEIPAIQMLRQVWTDQYTLPPEPIRWRAIQAMPAAAQQIASPYDPEARWSTKREVEWVGYKVHLTETCDETLPHLITHIETTVATTPDDQVVAKIHADLADKDRLPSQHIVDTGYTDAELLVTSSTLYGLSFSAPSLPIRAGRPVPPPVSTGVLFE